MKIPLIIAYGGEYVLMFFAAVGVSGILSIVAAISASKKKRLGAIISGSLAFVVGLFPFYLAGRPHSFAMWLCGLPPALGAVAVLASLLRRKEEADPAARDNAAPRPS